MSHAHALAHHHDPEEMLKHIKVYVVVFLALALLTGVTVWASYIHVATWLHITIAMTIAAVKAGMVIAFFMHLITEKKLIRSILVLTGVFFIVLILLTLFVTDTNAPSSPIPYPGKAMNVPIEHIGL